MNRSVSGIVVFVVAVVGFLGYKAFFVDTDEVVKFNDSLVDMVGKSSQRFNGFNSELDRYFAGQRVDSASMSRMRSDLEKGIKADLDRLRKMTVPDDELCKDFHGNCVKFVEHGTQITAKYGEVIDYISKHNPGTGADADAVKAMLAGVLNQEQRLLVVTSDSQKKLAKKFDFKLK